MGSKKLWTTAAIAVAVITVPVFGNLLSDSGFDTTVANAGSGPWFSWGWAGFHPFGGNNPEWWGDSAAFYAGTTADAPDTSGIFFPAYGTHEGLSLEGLEFQVQFDLYPQENFAAQIDIGIQWRSSGGGNDDAIYDDVITVDLTDPVNDPAGVSRGQYNTVTVTAIAPANAYYAVPIAQCSNIVNTATNEHWCYVDNARMTVTDNLVENAGFEADNSNEYPWVIEGDAGLASWGGSPHNHIFWYANTLEASGQIYQPGICATEGNVYEISINNSFQESWGADLEYGFRWMAADDETEISSNLTLIAPLGFPPIPHQRYAFTVTAPAGASFVRPVVRYSNVQWLPDPIVDNSAPTDNIIVRMISGVTPDADGDGVTDCSDACPGTVAGAPVNADGRPIADLDGDCDVDLADFSIMTQSFSGPQQ